MNNLSDKLDELWTKTIASLEKQLSVPEYAAWIAPIRPVSFVNNRLLLHVPSDLAREKVEQKYFDLLRTSFLKNSGRGIPDLEIILSVDSNQLITQATSFSPVIQISDIEKPNLNPRYSFSSFVVGNSNKCSCCGSGSC